MQKMPTRPSDVFQAARALLAETPLGAAGKFLHNFLLPEELEQVWAKAAGQGSGTSVFARFLAGLGVECDFSEEDLSHLPPSGGVVVVANHPFGMVEGAVLGALLHRVRPDFKFLANSLLAGVPELNEYLLAVNPFGGAAQSNWRALRQAIAWLQQGGALVTFPAGAVSSLQLPRMEIADPAWNENISRIIQMTGSPAIPIFFHGANGAAFQIAGLIHPGLRTALLPLELLNKRGQTIRVSIGRRIAPECLSQFGANRDATEYLWQRTHVLQARKAAPARIDWWILPRRAPIAGAVDPRSLRAEAEQMTPGQTLIENREYRVYLASADQIPNTLREIGRLREISFREAGEGTGRSLDLDRFDSHYQHLWIWNAEQNQVAGAYRLAATDEVLSRFGPRGLYTSTLFRFRRGLFWSSPAQRSLARRISKGPFDFLGAAPAL
jgi:putative hemolysin